jgi:hypothetical protein
VNIKFSQPFLQLLYRGMETLVGWIGQILDGDDRAGLATSKGFLEGRCCHGSEL